MLKILKRIVFCKWISEVDVGGDANISGVNDLKRVSFLQPKNKKLYCAISNIAIVGMKPADVANTMHSKYKIHTVAIDWENIHGTRVTPHVYTSTKDLDRLVKAIREMVG